MGIGYAFGIAIFMWALPEQLLWFGKRASKDVTSSAPPCAKRGHPGQEDLASDRTSPYNYQELVEIFERALGAFPTSFYTIQGFDVSWQFEIINVVPDARHERMVHYALSCQVCDVEASTIMKPIRWRNLQRRGLPHPCALRDNLALQLKVRQESAARGYEIRIDCIAEHQAAFFSLFLPVYIPFWVDIALFPPHSVSRMPFHPFRFDRPVSSGIPASVPFRPLRFVHSGSFVPFRALDLVRSFRPHGPRAHLKVTTMKKHYGCEDETEPMKRNRRNKTNETEHASDETEQASRDRRDETDETE
eukprot:7588697-Karenia_brevis.AAC.1